MPRDVEVRLEGGIRRYPRLVVDASVGVRVDVGAVWPIASRFGCGDRSSGGRQALAGLDSRRGLDGRRRGGLLRCGEAWPGACVFESERDSGVAAERPGASGRVAVRRSRLAGDRAWSVSGEPDYPGERACGGWD